MTFILQLLSVCKIITESQLLKEYLFFNKDKNRRLVVSSGRQEDLKLFEISAVCVW